MVGGGGVGAGDCYIDRGIGCVTRGREDMGVERGAIIGPRGKSLTLVKEDYLFL